MIALSIRQPWAWLIVNGYKDVENRTRFALKYRGQPILIHAGKAMTKDDYRACVLFVNAAIPDRKFTIPPYHELRQQCGGIVGQATIRGCGDCDYPSPWWTGGVWWLMKDAKPLPFHPCAGTLGFFDVKMP